MAKREFIDKQMMLSEYSNILDCEINHSKYEVTVKEVIEEANEISVQDIVRPYLEKFKRQLKQDIQNGLIQVSKGNEKLFADIDELLGQDDADYTAETEEEKEM